MQTIKLINADVIAGLNTITDNSIDTIITSPPYWGLRDYGEDGQMGLEGTLEEYHAHLLEVTTECMRVLKPTGVMFWNHGDSYNGIKIGSIHAKFSAHVKESQTDLVKVPEKSIPMKSMVMQNERLIIKMIDDQGWILRNRIIWNKPNGMPSSVTDRFSNKYEPVYMLTKQKSYWFDLDAVRVPHKEVSLNRQKHKWNPNRQRGHPDGHEEKLDMADMCHPLGKNPGDVWTIPTQPYPESHFATFPTALIEPMIKAACPAEICPVCGMARERIVEIEKLGDEDDSTRIKKPRIGGTMREVPEKGWKSVHHTVGWTSCTCNAGFVPGTILDPFAGAGTTSLVARDLGRSATGIDISPDYCKIAMNRIDFAQMTIDNSIKYVYEAI